MKRSVPQQTPRADSKIVNDLRLHPNRLSIRRGAGAETGAFQDVVQPAVVAAVTRRIEFPIEYLARRIHVEFRNQVKATHLSRKRQRRDEQLDGGGRIVRLNPTAGSRPV